MPAKKTPAKKKTESAADQLIADDIQGKVDAYAEAHGLTSAQVIDLALRDWIYDLESGQRPRSNSILEPALAR